MAAAVDELDHNLGRYLGSSSWTAGGRAVVRAWQERAADPPTLADARSLRAQLDILEQAAHRRADAGIRRDGTTTVAGDQAAYAALVLAAEAQRAYAALVQAAAKRDDVSEIERIVHPDACEVCSNAAGVHKPDFPGLYDTHPGCLCDWRVAGDVAMSWRDLRAVFDATGAPAGHASGEMSVNREGSVQIEALFAVVTKTEDGLAFPADAYAYVPDPQSPSTWKLRLWQTPQSKETAQQVGAAVAALSPGGFRGQKVAIPAGDLEKVKARIRAAWKKANPDKDESEMPASIAMSAGGEQAMNRNVGFADAPVKQENGMEFPASAYAHVPDPSDPATWKLRLWESPDTKETPQQVGASAGALGPQGERGNMMSLAPGDLLKVKSRLRAAWRKANPGKSDDAMPAAIKDLTTAAAMSAEDAGNDDDLVIRTGKVFECGDFPDKRFSITPSQAEEAIANFQPASITVEHAPSVLDGKLGQLQAVRMGADGWSIEGDLAIPRWLDRILGAGERKVSVVWNRTQPRIEALGLVRDPRIPDAVFTAGLEAFAIKHNTPSGQAAMQQLHDVAAKAGAQCKAPMASQHEAGAIQQIHDISTDHGAVCEMLGTVQGANSPALPFMSRDAQSQERSGGLVAAVRGAMEGFWGGRRPEPVTMPAVPFGQEQQGTPAAGGQEGTAMTNSNGSPFAAAQQQSELERVRAEVARLKAEKIQTLAETFADGEIREHRAFPAEREAIVAMFCLLAMDDETHGPVTFASGQAAPRLEGFRAMFAMRPAHKLTSEQIVTETKAALFGNRQTTPELTGREPEPERGEVDRLLAMTDAGRKVLSVRNGNQRN